MKIFPWLVIALFLLSISGATAQTEFVKKLGAHVTCTTRSRSQAFPIRDKWAVLVSIGRYQDQSIKPLQYAQRNLVSLAKALRSPSAGRFLPAHVVSLSDAYATRTAVEEAITGDWLAKKALPNDLIVLYLCGRVFPKADRSDVILCACDTSAASAESSGVPLKQALNELKHKTQARAIVCLLDLSPMSKNGEGDDVSLGLNAVDSSSTESYPSLNQWANEAKIAILSANEIGKPSYENPLSANSYFAHYLADGLASGLGTITLQAVAQYVGQNVESDVRKQIAKTQMPLLAVPDDSPGLKELVLGVPIKSKNYTACNLSIGHPVGELALQRPDLLVANDKLTAARLNSSEDVEEEDNDQGSTSGVNFGPYMAKIKRDIQAKWIPQKGFEDRRVVVVFSITRDGSIKDAEVVGTSGVDSVDKTALEALHLASPLPPLPKGAPKSVKIRYQFDWRVVRNNVAKTGSQ